MSELFRYSYVLNILCICRLYVVNIAEYDIYHQLVAQGFYSLIIAPICFSLSSWPSSGSP